MGAEAFEVWLAAAVGLALSVAIEQWIRPRPALVRPWAAWALHGGVWLLAHAAVTLLLGRPWFATAGVSAILLIVVLVSNAKVGALREPFVFQDFDYFTDAIRHPRLYIPFMGWGRFLAAVTGGAAAIALGLWGEAAPAARWRWEGQCGGIATAGGAGVLLLLAAMRRTLPVTFDPDRDLRALGLIAFLWRYAEEERRPPVAVSPFGLLPARHGNEALPHLIAVQSESFFDPRPYFSCIRPEVLATFDRLCKEAVFHGQLQVPAWGANTVRSEFAFLTGIEEEALGVHRFNPYRAIAAGWPVASLAAFLKRLGYRTVCIHPYPASFYQRDRVCPRLGFDVFLDIGAFEGAQRFGPYVADAAVAEKIEALLREARGPLFIYAITMENHGPLHLERVAEGDIERLYRERPPPGCEDLTIYLRHLANADHMLARLREALDSCGRPASLCWFGDHVPIMPKVYATLGAPPGAVDYLVWSSHQAIPQRQGDWEVGVSGLGLLWLRTAIGISPM